MAQTLTTARNSHERAVGVGLVLAATIGWSFSGVFTRLLTIDVWTAIAWRSFFGGLFLLIPYLLLNGRQSAAPLLSIGRAGLLLAACNVVCQACTVGGLYFTTVANVTVIYATSPFLAAALAWLVIGERIRRRTVIAGLVCFAGIIVIIYGSLATGHLLGDVLALGMTVTFAFMVVIPRAYPDLQMLPTTIISAFATFVIFAPFGSIQSIDIHNWLVLAGFGLTNFSIALFLFLAGARRIESAEAAMIGILEIVLAPIWVWLWFAESPGWPALAGGAIILLTVIWHTILDLRRERAPRLRSV